MLLIGISFQRCNTFNRTIVELKFRSRFILNSSVSAFNRTIVELKYNMWQGIYRGFMLLIVP